MIANRFAAVPALLIALCTIAQAQIQLPGAAGLGGGGGGTGAGAPAAPAGERLPPKPVVMDPPSDSTVINHALSLNGRKGAMLLDRKGDALVLTKLTLAGEKLSKPGQSCSVDVPLATPISLRPLGHLTGANRYEAPVPECPLSLDILNGAALVQGAESGCTFRASDCKIEPGGLWGPPAAEISPKRAQDLERERVRLETTMRANFHALVRKAGSDRAAVKALARDQAAFSSEREMTCRDYQDEATHGFCSTQITQARALALLEQFGPVAKGRDHAPRSQAKSQQDKSQQDRNQ